MKNKFPTFQLYEELKATQGQYPAKAPTFMKIKLLTPELYEELQTIQADYPELTFQNKGYQYLSPEVWEAHKEQIDRITEILREHVTGFSEFYNFRLNKEDAVVLRFNYNWGAAEDTLYYQGVGYVTLDQLLHGFQEEASQF